MMNANQTIKLAEKFSQLDEYWSPRIVGELNGQYVKVAKLKGEFTWHQHDDEDEMFLVIQGQLKIELEDRQILIGPGELAVIPKGTQHRPVCEGEAHVVLIEPKSTVNTGNVKSERTVDVSWL
jgi:mannose-6-phosphate isomerase-like protein (cupin superfamily)